MNKEYEKLRDDGDFRNMYLNKVKQLLRFLDKYQDLQAENQRLRKALDILVPIVEEGFRDHSGAGNFPGSGYSHKIYYKISEHFGWRDSKKWNAFKEALKENK